MARNNLLDQQCLVSGEVEPESKAQDRPTHLHLACLLRSFDRGLAAHGSFLIRGSEFKQIIGKIC
jgi:hypothetical protein